MTTEKCNCFDDVLNRAKAKFKEEIKGPITDFNVEWMNYSYFFSGDRCPVNPKLEISYREQKRNGEPKANLTKKQVSILCSYCPMCGRELEKDGVQNEQL